MSTSSSLEMMAEDISTRKNVEAQLRQVQKIEAVGRMTAGIAHDFNNILTVILSDAELIAEALPEDLVQLHADIGDLQRAAQRGATIVRKLLTFCRRGELERRSLDLAERVREMSDMLRTLLPEHIELDVVAEDPVGTIRADAGAVEQIVLNLATNARDAMPDGGVLGIELRHGCLDDAHRATHGWGEPGDYLLLIVSDTGTGMDERIKQRIFEPFFTTKGEGEGTGLGMAMVYELVKQQGGYVDVESKVGSGTTVTLYFPVVPEEAVGPDAAGTASLTGGKETVLLVDDEESIRRAAKRVLENFGYFVVRARDGEHGLKILREYGTEIDIVITDLVMPRLGGIGLYEAVRGSVYNGPFLFMSGYAPPDVRERTKLDPTMLFLRKPWTLSELVLQVRKVLDTPRSSGSS